MYIYIYIYMHCNMITFLQHVMLCQAHALLEHPFRQQHGEGLLLIFLTGEGVNHLKGGL